MMRTLFTGVALLVVLALTLPAAVPRPDTSAQAPAETVSGKLSSKDGKFYLTDAATSTLLEIRGTGLRRWVGKTVRLTGRSSPAAAGLPAVFTVSQVTPVAAAGTGGKAAAAGVKGGLSKAAVVGIVAGGGTAATVGTLYAADVIGGDDEPASRR